MTLLKAHRRAWLFAVLAILSATTTPAFAQKKSPDGVKILLLSGGARQHHGYREQALLLSSALEDTGRYEVTICEDGSILTSPGMSKYSVLIVHVDRRDPEFKFTTEQQQALLDFVRSGKGYISIHGGDNAAPRARTHYDVFELFAGIPAHQKVFRNSISASLSASARFVPK